MHPSQGLPSTINLLTDLSLSCHSSSLSQGLISGQYSLMATLLSPFSRFSPLPLESSLPESLPSIPGENIWPLPLHQAGPQRSLRLTASCRPRPEGLDTSRCHPPLWPLPPSAASSGIGSSPSGTPLLSSSSPHSWGLPCAA